MASQITVSQEHFKYDYHSGNGVGLWIGSNQVTEAVGVEFDLFQTKQPVYGYASSLYDGVASGVVQVSGMIYLNFQQAQLMSTWIANSAGSVDVTDLRTGFDVDALTGIEIKPAADLIGIEEISEELKETYWGNEELSNMQEGSNFSLESDAGWIAHSRPDQHLEGFDIVVTYGVPFSSGNSEHTHSTLRVIKNARIIGFGQVVSPDGEPIIERYNFLAREVI